MPPLFPVLRVLNQCLTPDDGPWNMACDEALLQSLKPEDPPLLRLYRWAAPTLSFGYFLKHTDAVASARPGEALIRRWTGGGMVHHGEDFTWSLLVPREAPFAQERPAESYGQLHQAVAKSLRSLGISDARVVPAQAPAPRDGLCFEAPAPGDLLLHGKKIAGAGQRRSRRGLLHQASLLLPGAPPAWRQNLPSALASAFGREIIPFSLPLDLTVPQAAYADPAWNQRI